MCYSIVSGDRVYVKGCRLLLFAINIGKNTIKNWSVKYSQGGLNSAKKIGA